MLRFSWGGIDMLIQIFLEPQQHGADLLLLKKRFTVPKNYKKKMLVKCGSSDQSTGSSSVMNQWTLWHLHSLTGAAAPLQQFRFTVSHTPANRTNGDPWAAGPFNEYRGRFHCSGLKFQSCSNFRRNRHQSHTADHSRLFALAISQQSIPCHLCFFFALYCIAWSWPLH